MELALGKGSTSAPSIIQKICNVRLIQSLFELLLEYHLLNTVREVIVCLMQLISVCLALSQTSSSANRGLMRNISMFGRALLDCDTRTHLVTTSDGFFITVMHMLHPITAIVYGNDATEFTIIYSRYYDLNIIVLRISHLYQLYSRLKLILSNFI